MRSLLALALLLGSQQEAWACACCTQGQEVEERDESLSEYELAELTLLRLKGTFGIDEIYGPANSAFDFKPSEALGTLEDGVLTLSLSRDGAKLGTLKLVPAGKVRWLVRDAQLLDSKAASGTVYKELRLSGRLEASKELEQGLGYSLAKEGTLYLHGTGNACLDPGDFHQWSLSYGMSSGSVKQEGRAHGMVETAPDTKQAQERNSQGMDAYKRKDYRTAAALFSDAAELDPGYTLALTNLACAQSLSGDKAGAVGSLKKALAIDRGVVLRKMKTDKDFDPIRSEPEFQELMR